MNRATLTLAAAAMLLPPAAAQTGPWTDGELIVLTASSGWTIKRVVPETGATAPLITPLYYGGWSGGLCFDSYRGGLLANISLPPDNPFAYRLWLVSHDGTAAAMPGFTGSLRALASAGDGRVFFIRHSGMAQGPKTVEYFDAANVIQTLKDVDGVSPFKIEAEHLLYHPATNSLVGSTSGWWAATHCSGTAGGLWVIPLSPDGLKVAGPVTCASIATAGEEIMGLDHLPGGGVLVTLASGAFYPHEKLVSFNPVSLALTPWGDPDQGNINGGLWSARLGKALIHADWITFGELRTFNQGQSGLGTKITTSETVASGGGYSPAEVLYEVDLNGPQCDGFQLPYGTGLAGSGGHVPLLGVIGCPDIGSLFTISINNVVGGAAGVLFVGLAQAAVPFKGGTFLVGAVAAQLPVAVGGTPGLAGAGSLALPALLSDPILSGINIYMQAGFSDSFAVKGVSLSNGVQFQGG
ncbi:MAG: hypothetical protein FJ296_02335 [Planctomycetes bacterium]|nr:hypothetical protein [Planctomycetota bacterium]